MVLGMFRYLGRRPALQELPEGRSIWSIGFYRVAATVKTLRTEFRTLGCFYLGPVSVLGEHLRRTPPLYLHTGYAFASA